MIFERFCRQIQQMVETGHTTVEDTVDLLSYYGHQTTRDVPQEKREEFIHELKKNVSEAIVSARSVRSNRQQQ